VKWRALAVAVSGLVGLASCDFGFGDALGQFCTHPGRCAAVDASSQLVEISQGASLMPVTITGTHLAGASVEIDTPGIGTVSSVDAGFGEVTALLTIEHGVDAGTTFKLRLGWARDVDYEYSDTYFVTPIVVANDGDDGTGKGTYIRPFASLRRAGLQSSAGDTIHLRPGRYDSIFPDVNTLCDAGQGLKPGVTVEGEGAEVSHIDGQVTRAGTCAFNLSSGDQVVQRLTIVGFPEGIRASGAGRPRVIDVSIYDGGVGVAAAPGSSLLLQRVSVQEAGRGMVLDSADVVIQEGAVISSYRTGVSMIGNRGTLVIDGTKIELNGDATSLPPLDRTGLLVAADAGFAFVDGGTFRDNGSTGITVTGSSNTVAVDRSFVRSGRPDGIGLDVQLGSRASVYVASTRFQESNWNIRVADFAVFNGGKGDAGWAPVLDGGRSVPIGGNDLQYRWQSTGIGSGNIWDARPGGAGREVMTFARTTIDGGWIPPPTPVNSTSTFYGIQVDTPTGPSVSFE